MGIQYSISFKIGCIVEAYSFVKRNTVLFLLLSVFSSLAWEFVVCLQHISPLVMTIRLVVRAYSTVLVPRTVAVFCCFMERQDVLASVPTGNSTPGALVLPALLLSSAQLCPTDST